MWPPARLASSVLGPLQPNTGGSELGASTGDQRRAEAQGAAYSHEAPGRGFFFLPSWAWEAETVPFAEVGYFQGCTPPPPLLHESLLLLMPSEGSLLPPGLQHSALT